MKHLGSPTNDKSRPSPRIGRNRTPRRKPLPSPWICTNIIFKDELNGELGMAEAYIVEAVRTAGGKRGGRLAGWHPADMAGAVLDSVVARTGIDPAAIEDVIMGCVSQGGEQSFQVGRGAVPASGLPQTAPPVPHERPGGPWTHARQ